MQNILYRALGTKGWVPTEGKGWYFGTSIQADYEKEKHFSLARFERMLHGNYLDKKTRSVYIGLKDKNGQKMFDGDIVADGSGRVMVIVWCEDHVIDGEIINRSHFARFELKLIRFSKAGTDNFLYADFTNWVLPKNDLTIVGNVFENENLLTEEYIDGFGTLIKQ